MFLLEVRNDDSTRNNLEDDSVFTYNECVTWFDYNRPKWFIVKVSGIRVGYIRTNGDEVGCDIHPNHRRKGYARMAYQLYLEDKEYASLWVFEDNFAKNLYEDLGFVGTDTSKIVRGRTYIQMVWYR